MKAEIAQPVSRFELGLDSSYPKGCEISGAYISIRMAYVLTHKAMYCTYPRWRIEQHIYLYERVSRITF